MPWSPPPGSPVLLTGMLTGLLTSGHPVRWGGGPSLPPQSIPSHQLPVLSSAHQKGQSLGPPPTLQALRRDSCKEYLAEGTQAKHSCATSLGTFSLSAMTKHTREVGTSHKEVLPTARAHPQVPFPIHFPLPGCPPTSPWAPKPAPGHCHHPQPQPLIAA